MNIVMDEKKFQLTNVPDLSIVDQFSYEKVVSFRVIAKEREKIINETFDPIIEKNRSAWKQALATRDKFLNPVLEIIGMIDSNIKAHKREQDRKMQEEQERLRREAEERARKEQERLNARAEKWEEKGNGAKAESLREQAEQVEPLVPTAAPIFTKVKGDNTRRIWKAEVIDFKILSDDYKIPNEQLLNSIARSTKGQQKINGVKFYEA